MTYRASHNYIVFLQLREYNKIFKKTKKQRKWSPLLEYLQLTILGQPILTILTCVNKIKLLGNNLINRKKTRSSVTFILYTFTSEVVPTRTLMNNSIIQKYNNKKKRLLPCIWVNPQKSCTFCVPKTGQQIFLCYRASGSCFVFRA